MEFRLLCLHIAAPVIDGPVVAVVPVIADPVITGRVNIVCGSACI